MSLNTMPRPAEEYPPVPETVEQAEITDSDSNLSNAFADINGEIKTLLDSQDTRDLIGEQKSSETVLMEIEQEKIDTVDQLNEKIKKTAEVALESLGEATTESIHKYIQIQERLLKEVEEKMQNKQLLPNNVLELLELQKGVITERLNDAQGKLEPIKLIEEEERLFLKFADLDILHRKLSKLFAERHALEEKLAGGE